MDLSGENKSRKSGALSLATMTITSQKTKDKEEDVQPPPEVTIDLTDTTPLSPLRDRVYSVTPEPKPVVQVENVQDGDEESGIKPNSPVRQKRG